MRTLQGLKPERVFYYFEEMSKIPRCSYDEQRISDYLANVGRDLGLEVIQDAALNVIIKKPATKGHENAPTIVIQGHMDMVGEKTKESNHDFAKDPIKIEIDGDYIVAKETTLGADNGIAVAMGLALLESKDISHPALEVLITSNEESGMTGAAELDPAHITGRILINIDSEEEGTILVSCAGGERNVTSIEILSKELDKSKEIYDLSVDGLMGGHSGLEINKGRGNSNKILARVLNEIREYIDLGFIEGGSKPNAIPRYSRALVAIKPSDVEKVKEIILTLENSLKFELSSTDKDVRIEFEKSNPIDNVYSDETKNKIINILMLIPNGINTMSMDIEGLVESSNNVGVISVVDGKILIETSIRSSIETLKTHIANQIKLLAETQGASWESHAAYPSWEFKKDSYIREVFQQSYLETTGKELEVAAIHAGLECGLFKEKFGDIDMVSFGPNMQGVHAPGEKLSISSTENIYNLLLEVLKRIK